MADLDAMVVDLSSVAAAATVPAAIAQRATSMADRFGEIRDGWVQVRARIDAALETLAQVDRALPFIDLPTGPTEELAALDQRLADISASAARLRTGATGRVQAVVDGATGSARRRGPGGGRRDAHRGRAGRGRGSGGRAQGTMDMVMWITTVVLLLLVGYVAAPQLAPLRGYRR